MIDFETHPIGRVALLKQRIFDLEQKEKQIFIDGFRYGLVYICRVILGSDYPMSGWNSKDKEIAELAYREYKREWKDG